MKIVGVDPSAPHTSLDELEAQIRGRRDQLDAAAVLLAVVKANSVVTSTPNSDGTTTWIFRFASEVHDG